MQKIDAVILWVDGADIAWRNQMAKYSGPKTSFDDNRFRDWGLLKYWFRSVEKNAPWINKIHFITWGHVPEWLDETNPKLNIVKHDDFIPKKYLPTFNSNAIELNIHRIKDLSERFILFNDDVFLLNSVTEEDFFKNGMPRDVLIEAPIIPNEDVFYRTMFNNLAVINDHYDKDLIISRRGYYSLKYGKYIFSSWVESHHRGFVGFMNQHITTSFLKRSFEKLWEIEPKKCDETCLSKFRSDKNITQYLIRYMQLLDGSFIPRKIGFGSSVELRNDLDYESLLHGKEKVLCLNDSDPKIDFDSEREKLIRQFEKKFPEKSSYEK